MLLLPVLSAGADPPLITRIIVTGNRVTREQIIRREVNHPRPAPYDSLQARRDQNNLYNMGIFESVRVYPHETVPGQAELIIEVVETIRTVPIPLIYYLDDVGWSYGGGVAFYNFRGLNQRVLLSATAGGEKTYGLAFADPWLMGNRISGRVRAARLYRSHPVYQYRIMEEIFEVGVGKVSPQKTFGIQGTIGLLRRAVAWRDTTGWTPPGNEFIDRRDKAFRAKLDVLWRTTDIWRDPTRGITLRLLLSPVMGLDAQSPDYLWMYASGAVFRRLTEGPRPFILGLGLAVSRYDRQTPFYLRQFLGRTWVRGYHIAPADNPGSVRDRLEGNSLLVAGLEVRQMIFPRRLIWQVETGLAGVLFLDAGWAYGPGEPLAEALPVVGFGLGARIFLPIIELLALDMGFNRLNRHPHYRVGLSHKF